VRAVSAWHGWRSFTSNNFLRVNEIERVRDQERESGEGERKSTEKRIK